MSLHEFIRGAPSSHLWHYQFCTDSGLSWIGVWLLLWWWFLGTAAEVVTVWILSYRVKNASIFFFPVNRGKGCGRGAGLHHFKYCLRGSLNRQRAVSWSIMKVEFGTVAGPGNRLNSLCIKGCHQKCPHQMVLWKDPLECSTIVVALTTHQVQSMKPPRQKNNCFSLSLHSLPTFNWVWPEIETQELGREQLEDTADHNMTTFPFPKVSGCQPWTWWRRGIRSLCFRD